MLRIVSLTSDDNGRAPELSLSLEELFPGGYPQRYEDAQRRFKVRCGGKGRRGGIPKTGGHGRREGRGGGGGEQT